MEQVKKDLSDKIEMLLSQFEGASDIDKPKLEEQIRQQALKYKEITGNWYVREFRNYAKGI